MSLKKYFEKYQPATEGVSTDGMEREISYIGKIENPEDILTGSGYFENQEQWRVCFKIGERDCTMRCRRTRGGKFFEGGDVEWKDPVYTMTYKSYIKGQPETVEAEAVIPEAEGIRLMSDLKDSGNGMIKRRYFFPVGKGYIDGRGEEVAVKGIMPEGVIWEVDVFPVSKELPPETHQSAMFDFSPWVKFDLEVPQFNKAMESISRVLPFKTTDMEWTQPHERTDEEAKRVEAIFKEHMTAKKEG